MPKVTALDRQWDHLMSLCAKEAELARDNEHPRLRRLVEAQIRTLAAEMGFPPERIATREFRARREGGHIVGVFTS